MSAAVEDPFSISAFQCHVSELDGAPDSGSEDPFSISALARLMNIDDEDTDETDHVFEVTQLNGTDPFLPSDLGRQLSALSASGADNFCRQQTDEGWPMWVPPSGGIAPEVDLISIDLPSAPARIVPTVFGDAPETANAAAAFESCSSASGFDVEVQPEKVKVQVPPGRVWPAQKQSLFESKTKPNRKRRGYRRQGSSLISLAYQEAKHSGKACNEDGQGVLTLDTLGGGFGTFGGTQISLSLAEIDDESSMQEFQGEDDGSTQRRPTGYSSLLLPVVKEILEDVDSAEVLGADLNADEDDCLAPFSMCRQQTDEGWPTWMPYSASYVADYSVTEIGFELPMSIRETWPPGVIPADPTMSHNSIPDQHEEHSRALPHGQQDWSQFPTPADTAKRGRYRRRGSSLISQAHEQNVRLRKQAMLSQSVQAMLHQSGTPTKSDEPKPFVPKFCPECGGPLPSQMKARFCQFCGVALPFAA